MHILVIPSWYPHSYKPLLGVFFKEQAEMLAKYGNKVGIIAIQPIALRTIVEHKKLNFKKKRYRENGVETYKIQYPEIPKIYSLKEVIKLYVFKKIFKEYVNKNGLPDIVHLHSFMHGKLAIWLKEEYGIPFVTTEHATTFSRNILRKKEKIVAKDVFSKSDYNLAVSQEFVSLLKKDFSERFIYVPNIVNTDIFDIKSNNNNKDNFNFINIAFYRKKKRQDMLIKSFTKAFKDNKYVHLKIVGGGPEFDNLNKLILDLKMEDQIKLKGEASRDEVKELMQNSDTFVLSSQYETFGVVLIEAMACGLPVIATKCGGPETIIQNDKLGILCDVEEDSLSNALLNLYVNRNRYDANYIRKYAVDNFSEEAVYFKINKIYQDILESKK